METEQCLYIVFDEKGYSDREKENLTKFLVESFHGCGFSKNEPLAQGIKPFINAENALAYTFLYDLDSRAFLYEDIKKIGHVAQVEVEDFVEKTLDIIERENYKQGLQVLEITFKKIKNIESDFAKEAVHYCEEIYGALCTQAGIDTSGGLKSLHDYEKKSRALCRNLYEYFGSLSDENERLIEKACLYIDNNLDKKLSLNQISSTVNLSPGYFCRLFKDLKGENVSNYIIRKRLGKAKDLLCNSNKPISVIGQDVGYPSLSYFSRIYKKHMGLSPSEERISRQL